jgi:hypothetical protein
MKYIKTYETYEYNPNIPAWVNHLISLEHYDSVEIAEFLEEQLGTKETPLHKEKVQKTNKYTNSMDELIFIHWNYDDIKNSEIWFQPSIWNLLEINYNLEHDMIYKLIENYIKDVYELKFSYIQKTIPFI